MVFGWGAKKTKNKPPAPREIRKKKKKEMYNSVLAHMSENNRSYNFEDARLERVRLADTPPTEAEAMILSHYGVGGTPLTDNKLPEDYHEATVKLVSTESTVVEEDDKLGKSLTNRQTQLFFQVFQQILMVTGAPGAKNADSRLERPEFEAFLRYKLSSVGSKTLPPERVRELKGDWHLASYKRSIPGTRKVCYVEIDREFASSVEDGETVDYDDSLPPIMKELLVHESQLRVVEEVKLRVIHKLTEKDSFKDFGINAAMKKRQSTAASKKKQFVPGSFVEVQPFGKLRNIWPVLCETIEGVDDKSGMTFPAFCRMQVEYCDASSDENQRLMTVIDPSTYRERYDWVTPLCDNVVPTEISNRCGCGGPRTVSHASTGAGCCAPSSS